MIDDSTTVETGVAIGDDGTRLSVRGYKGDISLPAFVLVHGLASNARLWDDVMEGLRVTGHTVHAVDLRGHGRSEKPDQGYDFATMASDVAAVVRDVVGRRAVLVGQSWGGNVVLEAAARNPEIARAVACVDGGFIKLSERFDDWSQAEDALRPPRAGRRMTLAELEASAQEWFDGFPPAGIRGQLENFHVLDDGTVEPRLSLDRHMMILSHLWTHDPDRTADLVEVPVWVLAVGEDAEKRARVDEFARHLRRGRVVWSTGHHDIHAQRPDVVATMLVDLSSEVAVS